MKEKIHHHMKRHGRFVLAFLFLLAIWLAANTLNAYYTRQQVRLSFEKNFEKHSQDQLKAYSFGIHSSVSSLLNRMSSTLSAVANQGSTSQDMAAQNYSRLQTAFNDTLGSDARFESITLLDGSGKVLITANKLPVGQKFVGTSLSDRDYFKDTASSKKPIISGVFTAVASNRNILAFTAPILDAGNNLQGVIVGTSSIQNIASLIRLGQPLDGLSFVLTDSQGNIIMDETRAIDKLNNITTADPLIRVMENGAKTGTTVSEVNYRNQKVFAQGDVITVGNSRFFLASFYKQSRYTAELNTIEKDLSEPLVRSEIIRFFAVIVIFYALYRILRPYEKK